ncbi:MAG: cellulase family glycosylhydrolase [Blautia sp.]|nr:cellulase family glycosylhydrolase [Blautia sp.]
MKKVDKHLLFRSLLALLSVLFIFGKSQGAQAAGECLVSAEASNSWTTTDGICRQYNLSIANNGSDALTEWSIILDIGEEGRLDQFWCCHVSQTGTFLTIGNESYNGTISPGSSVSGIGIIVELPGKDTISGTYDFDPAAGTLTPIFSPVEDGEENVGDDAAETGEGDSDGGDAKTGEGDSDDGDAETGDGDSDDGSAETGEGDADDGSAETGDGDSDDGDVETGDDSAEAGQESHDGDWPNLKDYTGSGGMYGPLTLDGVNICNKSGKRVQLRGVSTHGLAWFPQYVNRETFQALRDEWGVNLIRLAMYTEEYGGYCAGGDRQALEALIDKGVNICRDLGLYCIIDWHILSDNNPLINKDAALDFFDRISAQYASYDNVIYEICNEPNGCSWSDVKTYADYVIPVIRANAPDSLIICGTTTWSQDVDSVAADPVAYPYNVLYAVHFYAASHGYWNRQKVVNAINAGTPVFVSEFSTCDASGSGAINYDEAEAWRELITDYNLSYAGWNLANKDESSSFFPAGCSKLSGWTDDEISDTGKWLRTLIRSGKGNPPVIAMDEPEPIDPEELYRENVFYLPEYLTGIDEETFFKTAPRTVIIAEGSEAIGSKAFAECTGLLYVVIPDSVISIADDAFDGSENVILVCGKDSKANQYAKKHNMDVRREAK